MGRTKAAQKRAKREAMLQTTRRVAVAIGWVVLGTLVVIGVVQVESRASAVLALEPVRIDFEWPAGTEDGQSWLPASFKRELLDIAYGHLDASPDPLDRTVLGRIGEDLLATGWFDRIDRVVRDAGGVVRVSGDWRLPAAVVRDGEWDRVVSSRAELLRPVYQKDSSGLRVVFGAASHPTDSRGVPDYGAVWPGEEVRAGVELLTMLRANEAGWDQIAGVDVSGLRRGSHLEIVTDRGTRVIWGDAPGARRPGEESDEVKLARLGALMERYERIDAGQRRLEIHGPRTLVDASDGQ